jgi:hypothetical protein
MLLRSLSDLSPIIFQLSVGPEPQVLTPFPPQPLGLGPCCWENRNQRSKNIISININLWLFEWRSLPYWFSPLCFPRSASSKVFLFSHNLRDYSVTKHDCIIGYGLSLGFMGDKTRRDQGKREIRDQNVMLTRGIRDTEFKPYDHTPESKNWTICG